MSTPDYLHKSDAPFPDELWQRIDAAVVQAARETLVARRFLPLAGPLGPGAAMARTDPPTKEEQHKDGFAVITQRVVEQVPQLYEDFWLYWRDLAMFQQEGAPADISAATTAAQRLALREDRMVFYGVEALGITGLFTKKGTLTQKRSDWAKGEGAFQDVAQGVATLLDKGRIGRHSLVISQDLWVQLQRIQGGTGVLESTRVGTLLEGRIFVSPVLRPGTAALLCAQAAYMDLVVGIDISTAYSEMDENLNHHLRVLETALPRFKAPDAILRFT